MNFITIIHYILYILRTLYHKPKIRQELSLGQKIAIFSGYFEYPAKLSTTHSANYW
jgi:hypothetical protein